MCFCLAVYLLGCIVYSDLAHFWIRLFVFLLLRFKKLLFCIALLYYICLLQVLSPILWLIIMILNLVFHVAQGFTMLCASLLCYVKFGLLIISFLDLKNLIHLEFLLFVNLCMTFRSMFILNYFGGKDVNFVSTYCVLELFVENLPFPCFIALAILVKTSCLCFCKSPSYMSDLPR